MTSLSCVIPAYDEEGRVGAVVAAAKSAPLVGEVIVVSDGSRDRTAEEARRAGADLVIELPANKGKGGAIFEGVSHARFPLILLLDADLVGLTAANIDSLAAPVLKRTADMAIGILEQDALLKVLPQISGQRLLAKQLILNHPDLAESGFHFELLLNHYAKRAGFRIQPVTLSGVSHVKKSIKYRTVQSMQMRYRLLRDIGSRMKLPIAAVAAVAAAAWIYLTTFAPYLGGKAPAFPALAPPTAQDRVLVVAAHPDDEILGTAGYLREAIKAGAAVRIVIVTNGDSNKFSATIESRTIRKDPQKYIREGNVRAEESLRALARLGISSQEVDFLGFPDRGLRQLLDAHWDKDHPYQSPYTKASRPPYALIYDASDHYTGQDLVTDLAELIREQNPTIILTHTLLDSHPDHRATALFVQKALGTLRDQQGFLMPRRYAFLVHADDFPRPFRYEPAEFLSPPKKLAHAARAHWLAFPLDQETEDLKRDAISEFKSQLESPFLNFLLKSFIRKNELFLIEENNV
jgi:LmbE family N-acetylglucosaminyl deacetylase